MNPIPYSPPPEDVFNPVANPSGTNADGFFYGDWVEVIDTTSSSSGHAGFDGASEATLMGLIPFNKVLSAQRWFMGFAYVDQSQGFLLRENPLQHPYLPHLRASDFSFQPYIPSPTIVVITPPSGGQPPQLGVSLKVASVFTDTSGSGKTLPYANYNYAICTVKFSGFRYNFLADNAVRSGDVANPQTGGQVPIPQGWGGNEWMRNTYFDLAPKLETLSADNNSYLAFAETSTKIVGPPSVPAGPTVGAKFPVPNAVLLAKSDYTLKWLNVPVNYISEGTGVFYPSAILNAIGQVNKYAFLDFDPETILFKAPTFDIKPWYYPAIDGSTMLFCDITMPLDYFDPQNGNPSSTHNGWQLMPYRVNGLWYYASRITPLIFGAVALNGVPYLPETDMSLVFNNPNYFIGY